MREWCRFLIVCVLGALAGPAVWAQPPKPAPEMERLKKFEGNWDATIKMGDMESKATATYKIDLGGMWLVGDFQGEFGGMKFQGKGMDTYDANKKKYVSVWIDSMSSSPLILEGNPDKDGKVMTMTGEGPGENGKPTKLKTTSQWTDKDTVVWTMATLDKDGKDQPMMTITYKRKK
jgi:hypothetical protein